CKPNGSIAPQSELERASTALTRNRSTPPAPKRRHSPGTSPAPVAPRSPAMPEGLPRGDSMQRVAGSIVLLDTMLRDMTVQMAHVAAVIRTVAAELQRGQP